jgi:hypothetical protein
MLWVTNRVAFVHEATDRQDAGSSATSPWVGAIPPFVSKEIRPAVGPDRAGETDGRSA